jgi:hypothetical protein
MEPSTAEEDLTVTNVHSGEEYVSENPLDNATEINENGQNIAYSENTIIEPDVNTGGDVNGIETASTSDRQRRNAKPSGKSLLANHFAKAWAKVQRAVTTLQNAPSSIDGIVKAIAQVRAEYNAYDNLHHNFANFLTHVGTRECMEELHKLDTLTQVTGLKISVGHGHCPTHSSNCPTYRGNHRTFCPTKVKLRFIVCPTRVYWCPTEL